MTEPNLLSASRPREPARGMHLGILSCMVRPIMPNLDAQAMCNAMDTGVRRLLHKASVTLEQCKLATPAPSKPKTSPIPSRQTHLR